ncbi:hypothetical protein EDB81DRAFT_329561 [Dactylonectria macrodidyma]|uniref:Secreted protein n=1 Tax=Dactylonectria macrodidyma TaxID=307937 RepID=A0A9P9FF76_9HYPO|nr:hypothetical protein EDB81DRAFT_329561 [Dactylonectria macrodidyma]
MSLDALLDILLVVAEIVTCCRPVACAAPTLGQLTPSRGTVCTYCTYLTWMEQHAKMWAQFGQMELPCRSKRSQEFVSSPPAVNPVASCQSSQAQAPSTRPRGTHGGFAPCPTVGNGPVLTNDSSDTMSSFLLFSLISPSCSHDTGPGHLTDGAATLLLPNQ